MGRRAIFSTPLLNYVLLKTIKHLGPIDWLAIVTKFKSLLDSTDVIKLVQRKEMKNIKHCKERVSQDSCMRQYNKLHGAYINKNLEEIIGSSTYYDKSMAILSDINKKYPMSKYTTPSKSDNDSDEEIAKPKTKRKLIAEEDDDEETAVESEHSASEADVEAEVEAEVGAKVEAEVGAKTEAEVEEDVIVLTPTPTKSAKKRKISSEVIDITKIRETLLSSKNAIEFALQRIEDNI